MMRTRGLIKAFTTLIAASMISGCAVLYSDLKTPMPHLAAASNTENMDRVGKASCQSYVWVVATGDCSLKAAMDEADLRKVHHVDNEMVSVFFGIYTKFTTVAYGE